MTGRDRVAPAPETKPTPSPPPSFAGVDVTPHAPASRSPVAPRTTDRAPPDDASRWLLPGADRRSLVGPTPAATGYDDLVTAARLPDPLRSELARATGASLDHVRVHAGDHGHAVAAAHAARAVTMGSDIYMGTGEYDPTSRDGRALIAHEVAHVRQAALGSARPPAAKRDASSHAAAEVEADRFASQFASLGAAAHWTPDIALTSDAAMRSPNPGPVKTPAPNVPSIKSGGPSASVDPDRDSDAPPAAPSDPTKDDIPPEEAAPIELVFADDPGHNLLQPVNEVLVPEDASYVDIAKRLYGDAKHAGGFSHSGRRVSLISLAGVVAGVATRLRGLIDQDNQRDVDWLVSKVSGRRIDGDDERAMISRIAWWADRGELRDTSGKSYFDILIDRLDHRRLHEWGPFGGTDHSATEWIIIEVEGKQDQLIQLLSKRGVRAPTYPRTNDAIPEYAAVTGPLPMKTWGSIVGTYTYTKPAAKLALYSTEYLSGSISVTKQLPIQAPTAERAVTELRSSGETGPRVMIPGGDGKFYGYAIDFKFFRMDYQPSEEKLTNWWWMYPGTVFIQGGEYHPEFGEGNADQRAHRKQLLDRALGSPDGTLERGLDFDVLSLATLDQRISMIERALEGRTADDASLITRILYATPIADFPKLERRLSTSGVMSKLLRAAFPEGARAGIGRVFTVRAMQSMRVPGEGQSVLPELFVGNDDDDFYHFAEARTVGHASSKSLAPGDFKAGDQVSLGHEQALPGEATAAMQSTVITIQPVIFRGSNIGANLYRGYARTLIEDHGPAVGPLLPTQLVKIRTFDNAVSPRIVSAMEAVAILEMPTGEMLAKLVSAHIKGGMWLLAGMQLGRAFGPALAEGLTAEGGATRAILGALGRAGATEVGRAALSNVALLGAFEVVDRNRKGLEASPMGREFLGLFDTVMMLWVAHDVGRLIATGILPRAVAAFDWAIAAVKGLDESLMPLRTELEALRRTVARYASTSEAAEAAVAGGGIAGGPAETKPGFFTLLRVSRGEVAAERLTAKAAGTAAETATKSVLDRLGSAVERAETKLAAATTDEQRTAATALVDKTSRARFNVAQRANQLKPDARAKLLDAVDGVLKTRPGSIEAMADLLSAAAKARQPNVVIAEVQKLVGRGISDDTLRVLGAKALLDPPKIDLAWLNSTRITDETLDFLGRDQRTPWDLYQRAAADPTNAGSIRAFRMSARGAGAEMVAETKAATLGTNVRRQVSMGSSEIDFDLLVKGKRRAFEIKGWTKETWRDALAAAIKRIEEGESKLTADEQKLVGKIDHMAKQLGDARLATGENPMLGITDALSQQDKASLRRVINKAKLGTVELVPLSETEIKEAAAGRIGESLGVPRP